ncbi:CoA-binding protein [Patescibacteria group bacterium]|jgi:succinyl-CoA synthetase alpha subunit|nr:CoA-binding protein [Patescibacteria group bacterium]
MSFPNAQARILIQGMTGKEGSRMARWMISSGANVVAGVTPGKGGQEVEGRPIFNSVKEAPPADVSCIVVPSAHVLSAVKEALDSNIQFIHVLTENIALHDAVQIRRLAKDKGILLFGPASVGVLHFPDMRIGYLGGEKPFSGQIKEGDIALISTSGGMTNELMAALSRAGLGIRLAMAIGGGQVVGTGLSEAIALAEADPDVKRIAVFAEPGQPLLRELRRGWKPSKPFILMLPGAALDLLPRGLPYGHTGTILGEDEPTVVQTREDIRKQGVACAATVAEFVSLMKQTYV